MSPHRQVTSSVSLSSILTNVTTENGIEIEPAQTDCNEEKNSEVTHTEKNTQKKEDIIEEDKEEKV